jgi:hypothetical protein
MIKKFWSSFHDKRIEKLKQKFIIFFHQKYPGKYCWKDSDEWAHNPARMNPFKIARSPNCKIESIIYGMCHCGLWQKGACPKLLPEGHQRPSKMNIEEFDDELLF